MVSILLVIFAVEAIVALVNAIGAAAINNLLWTTLTLLPIPTSKAAAQQRQLQAEYLKVRGEMNATSSQDEFAKWAKLRRQHDKLLEQLEAAKKSQEAARGKFDTYLTGIRLLLTRAPQFLIPFWFAKEPMFWLPHGWFPYWAEWIISFPRAPLGAVSVGSWQLACTGFVGLVTELIKGVLGLVGSSKGTQQGQAEKKREEPIKATGGTASAETVDEKKSQ